MCRSASGRSTSGGTGSTSATTRRAPRAPRAAGTPRRCAPPRPPTSTGSRAVVVRAPRAREAQHVLDEVREARRLALDVVERPVALLLGGEAAEPQRLEVEAHLRERRAQLVRDARDEVGAQPRELALAPDLPDRDERRAPPRRASSPSRKGRRERGRPPMSSVPAERGPDLRAHEQRAERRRQARRVVERPLVTGSDSNSDVAARVASPAAARSRAMRASARERRRQQVALVHHLGSSDVAATRARVLGAVDQRVAPRRRHQRVDEQSRHASRASR